MIIYFKRDRRIGRVPQKGTFFKEGRLLVSWLREEALIDWPTGVLRLTAYLSQGVETAKLQTGLKKW